MGVLLQKGSVKKYILKSAIYHTLSIVLISVLLVYTHIKQQNISDHMLYEYLSSVNTRVISDFLSRWTLYQIVHSVTHFIKWLGYRNGTQKLVLDISRKKQGHSILCFTFDGFPIRNASEAIFLSEGYVSSHSNMIQLNIGNVFDMAQKVDFSYEVFEKNGLNHIVFTQAIVQNEDGGAILDFNTYKKNINKYKEGK